MSELPYGPFGFPNVRAWGMAPPIAPRAAGPQDLDPVEAAAMPITPDPPVRKRRPGVAAFEAVLADVGGDYDKAIQVFASELASSGIAPDRAMQAAMARAEQSRSLSGTPEIFYDSMEQQSGGGSPAPTQVPFGALPDADPRTTRAERLAQFPEWSAGVDRRKAEYDRATGLEAPPQPQSPAGPYAEAGRPGYDRSFTPSEVLGNRAAAEAERDARLEPMMETNRRDMRNRQEWKEQNPEEAASLAANARARGDDYRRERMMYRMAQQSGRSIDEIRESPQFASVGQIPSRDGGYIPTLERTQSGTALQDMPTSLSADRDAAATKRLAANADREKQFRSQMMLAGASAGKNAVNTFNLMTPEQQRDVVETRMKFGQRDGGKSDEWDRRLDMARIQMENDRAEREKDRTLTREERQAAREVDERRFAEERARRDQEWKERSAQFERDFALRSGQTAQEAEASRQRHEQQMVGLQGQLAQIANQGQALNAKTEMEQQQAQRMMDLAQKAEREKLVAAEVQRYGVPGIAELMAGEYETPGAQEALESIAAGADQSWSGFYNDDARRFDAELQRLGVTDPEKRKQLVTQYGLSVTFGPSSRSGPISGIVNWMSGPYR